MSIGEGFVRLFSTFLAAFLILWVMRSSHSSQGETTAHHSPASWADSLPATQAINSQQIWQQFKLKTSLEKASWWTHHHLTVRCPIMHESQTMLLMLIFWVRVYFDDRHLISQIWLQHHRIWIQKHVIHHLQSIPNQYEINCAFTCISQFLNLHYLKGCILKKYFQLGHCGVSDRKWMFKNYRSSNLLYKYSCINQ